MLRESFWDFAIRRGHGICLGGRKLVFGRVTLYA